MPTTVTGGVAKSVCQSVCHDREPCKNGRTDRDAVWGMDSGGPKEACVRWGSAHWRNLANTTEPSVCCGDAAFLSNYFDHLFVFVCALLSCDFLIKSRVFFTKSIHQVPYYPQCTVHTFPYAVLCASDAEDKTVIIRNAGQKRFIVTHDMTAALPLSMAKLASWGMATFTRCPNCCLMSACSMADSAKPPTRNNSSMSGYSTHMHMTQPL